MHSTCAWRNDDLRFAQRFKPLSREEMDALRTVAVTAGPGGVKGPALEYWKRNIETP